MRGKFARETPSFIRHCVAKVGAKYGSASTGKAICVASAQKHGRMKPGSTELTQKGRRTELKHRSEPDAPEKDRHYKRVLAKDKRDAKSKTESIMRACIRELAETTALDNSRIET